MRKSLMLRQQLRDSIKSEIADRTRIHQAKIAAFKTARARPLLAGAAPQPAPLAMLANGDSWFDYPLDGNGISLSDTDIIAQLGSMGTVNPMIQNVAHYGDATTQEMAWPKQERMIQALQDQANVDLFANLNWEIGSQSMPACVSQLLLKTKKIAFPSLPDT